MFANLPNEYRTKYLDKVNFSALDEIPDCTKYKVPKTIKYINADKDFCGWEMVNITLSIITIFMRDEAHFLSLHPVRYDLVKQAISMGEIDMPIIYFGSDGIPSVQDGRHRLVALYKYGFKNAQVAVPKEQFDTIKAFFAQLE